MKVLFYNWDHIDGSEGGGVSVYLRNLLSYLLKNTNYKILYLNSGLTYTNDKKIRLIEITNSIDKRIKTYEILNSPVLAPVKQSIRNIQMYLEDQSMVGIIYDFIRDQKVDVIHFNNLEGLPLSILALKKNFPNTKFIYSVHNYFPICSRTNLWQGELKKEGHNCNKENYLECAQCYSQTNYNATVFQRRHTMIPGLRIIAQKVSAFVPDSGDPLLYQRFEQETIRSINNYFDAILAVSWRVKEILISRGINIDKIFTSYIGTAVAEHQLGKCSTNARSTDIFNIIYMGYMRREKGFYFMLDALENMESLLAKGIAVRFVARYSSNNSDEIERIGRLKQKFASVELINGYTKDNQRELLKGMHLGIVPVLWEDNLPQVAIEQVAYGVPILVSDLGGAKEICRNINFIFKSGNVVDFISKLRKILENKRLLDDFWSRSMDLVTMQQHVDELVQYYN